MFGGVGGVVRHSLRLQKEKETEVSKLAQSFWFQ